MIESFPGKLAFDDLAFDNFPIIRPVLHSKARGALNSLCGRARITTRKSDANSDAAGAE